MAAIISPSDVVQYNNFRFGNAFTSSTVTAKYAYDSAGRTVTHTVLTIRVVSKVVAGAAQNMTMDAVRSALERPGGELYFLGKGYDIEINTPGAKKDLRWGPKPQVLEWKTYGGGKAAEVVWQCEVCLNNCDEAIFQGQVMSFTYRQDVSQDEGGYSIRTISGTIIIPMTRVNPGGNAIPDTADNYFDRLVPALLPNFKRTIQRSLNEAKDTLTYSITDTEQAGNALPNGCVMVDASHRLNNERPSFQKWTGTISATYELEKGVVRNQAWALFRKFYESRALEERLDNWFWVPLSVEISEPQVHGKTGAAFSMTYALFRVKQPGDSNFEYPMKGIWTPVPGTDWNRWSQSLGLARANRGIAGIKHAAADDAIVDLCLGKPAQLRGQGVKNVNLRQRGRALAAGIDVLGDWDDIRRGLGVPEQIDPIASWASYECRLVTMPDDNLVVHKPLPNDTGGISTLRSAGYRGATESVLRSQFATPSPASYPAAQSSPTSVVQSLASTSFYVSLIGRAVRIGHEISPPVLLLAGGAPVHPANSPKHGNFFSTWIGGYTTHPIVCAEWNLRYYVQLPEGSSGLTLISPPRPDEPGNIFPGTVR